MVDSGGRKCGCILGVEGVVACRAVLLHGDTRVRAGPSCQILRLCKHGGGANITSFIKGRMRLFTKDAT
jgi:hypothetical protein